MTRRCIFSGCNRVLGPENVTGLCRFHSHTAGLCHCRNCELAAAKVKPPLPKHLKQIVVADHATTSGATREMRVTLPRAPWE